MPTTIHEYYGELYEECPTRQFIEGDEVIHPTWLNHQMNGYKSVYRVVSINLIRNEITCYNPIARNRYDLTWGIGNAFSEHGWLRKITEVPYDPTQMGDTDEDI
jgi:hypothetical protein